MRILFIHCDYFSFTVTEPTKFAEINESLCKSCSVKDALVAFITVEKNDKPEIVEKATEEFKIKTSRLGVKNLIIFPFAHLSANTCDPIEAQKIIDKLFKLKDEGFNIEKAPFGWEKVFSLTSKGHPLAESLSII